MFESIVQSLLEKYIGAFVKDFAQQDLKIGLLKGKAYLRNLELRRDALDFLNLPINIRAGYIGDISIDIPFRSLSSEPVVVCIDRVFAVLVANKSTSRPSSSADVDGSTKLERLKAHELSKFGTSDDVKAADDVDSDSFSTRLASKILANIQIIVRHIHFRFEDDSNPSQPCSLGVCIDEFSATTTDETFSSSHFTSAKRNSFVHKCIGIQGLSIYFNHNDHESFVDRCEALEEYFQQNQHADSSSSSQSNYTPISKVLDAPSRPSKGLSLRVDTKFATKRPLTLDSKALSSSSSRWPLLLLPTGALVHATVRIPGSSSSVSSAEHSGSDISISMKPISIAIDALQYSALVNSVVQISFNQRFAIFKSLRPSGPVFGNCRAWWIHAYRCVASLIKDRRQRFNWAILLEVGRHRRRYVQLYSRVLNHPSLKGLKEPDKLELQELDKKLPFESIILFRQIAAAQVRVELRGGTVRLRQPKPGIFSRIFGPSSEHGSKISETFSPEQLQNLRQIVDGDDGADSVDFLAGFRTAKVEAIIPNISIKINSAAAVSFDNTLFTVQSTLGISTNLVLSLQSWRVDNINENSSILTYDNPISAHGDTVARNQTEILAPLFQFRTNLTSVEGSDSRIDIFTKLNQIRFVIDIEFVTQLLYFFVEPALIHQTTIDSIKGSFSFQTLLSSISEPISWPQLVKLDLDIEAPVLVIPENMSSMFWLNHNQHQVGDSRRLYVMLGHWHIRSQDTAKSSSKLHSDLLQFLPVGRQQTFNQIYQTLTIGVTNFQLFQTGISSHYLSIDPTASPAKFILIEPTSVEINMFISNIVSSVLYPSDCPTVMLQASIQAIKIHINPYRLQRFVSAYKRIVNIVLEKLALLSSGRATTIATELISLVLGVTPETRELLRFSNPILALSTRIFSVHVTLSDPCLSELPNGNFPVRVSDIRVCTTIDGFKWGAQASISNVMIGPHVKNTAIQQESSNQPEFIPYQYPSDRSNLPAIVKLGTAHLPSISMCLSPQSTALLITILEILPETIIPFDYSVAKLSHVIIYLGHDEFQFQPISSVDVSAIEATLRKFSPGKFDSGFAVQSVNIHDLVGLNSKFVSMVPEKQHCIAVNIKFSDFKILAVDLSLGPVFATFSPAMKFQASFAQACIENFLHNQNIYAEVSTNDQFRVDAFPVISSGNDQDELMAFLNRLEFRFQLNAPKLIFTVSDQICSNQFVLDFAVLVDVAGKLQCANFSSIISDVRLTRSTTDSPAVLTDLVVPFSINFMGLIDRSIVSSDTIRLRAKSNLSEIKMRINTTDVFDLMFIVQTWESEVKARSNCLESSPSLENSMSNESSFEFGDFQVDLMLAQISLSLLNGGYSHPIARFQSSDNVSTRVVAFSQMVTCYTDIGAALDFYNSHNLSWEPVVEPFQVSVSVNAASNSISATFLSSAKMDINISLIFLDMIAQFARDCAEYSNRRFIQKNSNALEVAEHSSKRLQIDDSVPCRVVNGIEWPIEFFLSAEPTLSRLGPFETEVFQIPKMQSSDAHESIAVQIIGRWDTLPRVSIDKVGVTEVALRGDPSLRQPNIVFDIRVADGIKTVFIHSSKCISNHTDFDLEVLGAICKPGRTLWLPLLCSFHPQVDSEPLAQIDLRPISIQQELVFVNSQVDLNSDISDSSCQPIFSESKSYSHTSIPLENSQVVRTLSFDPCDSSIPSVHVSVLICKFAEKAPSAMRFEIHPPFVLRNLLPCELKIHVSNLDQESDASFQIECVRCEQSVSIYQFDHVDKMSVRILPLDLGLGISDWSDHVTLNTAYLETDDDILGSLRCPTNDVPLTVYTELSFPHGLGASTFSFFTKLWLYNLSHHHVRISETRGVSDHHIIDLDCSEFAAPVLFDYPEIATKPFFLQFDDSEWSAAIHPQLVGDSSISVVGCPASNNTQPRYPIGISIDEIFDGRTKTVKIVPGVVIVNQLSAVLQVSQCDTDASAIFEIQPKSNDQNSIPFYWPDCKMATSLRFRIQNSDQLLGASDIWNWSGYFSVEKIGEFTVRLRNFSGACQYVRVEVFPEGCTTYILVSPANEKFPPFRIENRSSTESIRFAQINTAIWQELSPNSACDYAWDHPLETQQLTVFVLGDLAGGERQFDLDQFESKGVHLDVITLRFPDRHLFVYKEIRGPTVALIISDWPSSRATLSLAHPQYVDRGSVINHRLEWYSNEVRRLEAEYSAIESIRQDFEDPDLPSKLLVVDVVEARLLEAAGISGQCDVFAEIVCGDQAYHTAVVCNSRNPLWPKVHFPFPIGAAGFSDVRVTLYQQHFALGINSFLGGIIMELNVEEIQCNQEPFDQWFAISPIRTLPCIQGDIRIRVCVETHSSFATRISDQIYSDLSANRLIVSKLSEFISTHRRRSALMPKAGFKRFSLSSVQPSGSLFSPIRTSFADRRGSIPLHSPMTPNIQPGDINERLILVAVRIISASGIQDALQALRVSCAKYNQFYVLIEIGQQEFRHDLEIEPTLEASGLVANSSNEYVALDVSASHDSSNILQSNPSQNQLLFSVPESSIDEKSGVVRIRLFAEHVDVSHFHVSTLLVAEGTVPVWLATASSVEQRGLDAAIGTVQDTMQSDLTWVELWTPAVQVESEPAVSLRRRHSAGLDNRLESPHAVSLTESIESKSVKLGLSLLRLRGASRDHNVIRCVLRAHQVGVSLIDKTPQELLYFSISDATTLLDGFSSRSESESAVADSLQQVHLEVSRIQIDNQIASRYPAMLFSRSGIEDQLLSQNSSIAKFLRLGFAVRQSDDSSDFALIDFPYFHFAMHEFNLELEEAIIWALIEFGNDVASSFGLQNQKTSQQSMKSTILSRRDVLHPPAAAANQFAQKFFFQRLRMLPMAVNLSFNADPSLRRHRRKLYFNPFAVVLRLAGGNFASFESAPLRIRALNMDEVFGGRKLFESMVFRHFIQVGMLQWFKILGSFDLIGNPIDLLSQVADGVRDFVVEPFVGLQESPFGFGRGLTRGTVSLLRKSIVGLFGAASKITRSVGRTIAFLSVDDDFLARYGTERDLLTAVKKVGTAVVRCVTGLVTHPYDGIRRDGCTGFFTGFCKGVAGVVAKPPAAVLNLVSHACTKIRDMAALTEQIDTVRPPRFIQDGVVDRFDETRGLMFALYRSYCARKIIPPPVEMMHEHAERLLYFVNISAETTIFVTSTQFALVTRGQNDGASGDLVPPKSTLQLSLHHRQLRGISATSRRTLHISYAASERDHYQLEHSFDLACDGLVGTENTAVSIAQKLRSLLLNAA